MHTENIKEEFEKAEIEQLHRLVLQLSKNCFEIKKLCATVIISVSVLITTFTQQQIDYALFAGSEIVVVFFYLLDAQSYFYQRKARFRMTHVAESILEKRGEILTIHGVGMPLSSSKSKNTGIIKSLFNSSMLFYFFLTVINGLLAYFWKYGLLNSFVSKP